MEHITVGYWPSFSIRAPKAVQSHPGIAAKRLKSKTWPETALLTGGEFHAEKALAGSRLSIICPCYWEGIRQRPGLVLLYGGYHSVALDELRVITRAPRFIIHQGEMAVLQIETAIRIKPSHVLCNRRHSNHMPA